MRRFREGSTAQLLQFCAGYFSFYVLTGVAAKYFLGRADQGFPGMKGIEFLVFSTIGSTCLCVSVVLSLRWYRLQSNQMLRWGPLHFPSEYLYIVPSGFCTAFLIPATTLMYTLPISVMVAMILMRGSVIVSSRLVDVIQQRQGLLKKKVHPEENVAVILALSAVFLHLLWAGDGAFAFVHSRLAMVTLSLYIVIYGLRIYIMNYYKNTRKEGVKLDSKGFFAVEQVVTSLTLLLVGVLLFVSPGWFGWDGPRLQVFQKALRAPNPYWPGAIAAGMAFGAVAFFSVFIFMFKDRSATFAGLVNRLTSLLAGTAATLIFHFFFGGAFPKLRDWLSLLFIMCAILLLARAEHKRRQTLEGVEKKSA